MSDISDLNKLLENSSFFRTFQLKIDARGAVATLTEFYNRAFKMEQQNLNNIPKQESALRKTFGAAMSNFAGWVATEAVSAALKGLSTAMDTAVTVDSQKNAMKKAMDSSTDFEKMLENSVSLSKELGQNITQINDVIIGFATQGYNEEQVLALTQTAALMTNLSDLSGEEAMSSIISAMNHFNIEASKSIQIIDSLNAIDDNFAVSTKDLAVAMMNAGAYAHTFGVELEQMLGHITAIGQTTKESGASIGDSLNTIYSQLTTHGTSVKALDAIGISIKNNSGEMKGATEIIDELAGKWNSLSAETQLNTAVAIAGREQYSHLMALMNNYQVGLDATTAAMDSQGSAMRGNSEYMNSLEGRMNQLKAGWQEIGLTLGNAALSDSLLTLTSGLTFLANGAANIIEQFGLIPVTLGIAATAFVMFSSKARSAVTAVMTTLVLKNNFIRSLAISTNIWATSMGASATAARILTSAVVGLAAAVRGLLIATGVGALVAGLTFLVEKGISAWSNHREEVKKNREELDQSAKAWSEQQGSIQQLIDTFKELSAVSERTVEQEQEYLRVQNELAELMPNLVARVDSRGQSHIKSGDALERELDLIEKISNLEKERRTIDYEKDINKLYQDRSKLLWKLNSNEKTRNFSRNLSENQRIDLEIEFHQNEVKLNDVIGQINQRISEHIISKLELDGVEVDPSVSAEIDKMISAFNFDGSKTKEEIQEIVDEISSLVSLSEKLNGIEPVYGNIGYENAVNEHSRLAQKYSNINEAIKQSFIEAAAAGEDKLIPVFDELGNPITIVTDKSELLAQGFENIRVNTNDATGAVESFTVKAKEAEDLDKILSSTISEIKELNQVIHDVSNSQSLSADKVIDLTNKYPQLISAVHKAADGWTIEENALNSVRLSRIELLEETKRAESGITDAIYNDLDNRLSAYGIEIEAIHDLASAKVAAAKIVNKQFKSVSDGAQQFGTIGNLAGGLFGTASLLTDEEKDMVASLMKLGELKEDFKNYKELLNDGTLGVTSSRSSQGSSSSSNSYIHKELQQFPLYGEQIKDLVSQLISLENQMANARNEMDVAALLGDTSKKIAYENQYNNLLEQQLRKREEIANQLRSMREEAYSGFDQNFGSFRNGRDFENISAVETQEFINSLDKQLNEMDRKIGESTSEATKTALQKQKEALSNDRELFNYYVGLFDEIGKAIQTQTSGWIDDYKNMLSGINNVFDDNFSLTKDNTTKSLEDIDRQLVSSNRTLKQFSQTSQEYRDELLKQNDLLKTKQQIVHAEAEYLREQLRTQNLTAAQIEEINKRLEELSGNWFNFNDTIRSNTFSEINSLISESTEAVTSYNRQLDFSNMRLRLLSEGTKEYSDELLKQIDLLRNKLAAEENNEKVIREQMSRVDLTEEQWRDLNQQLKNSVIAQMEITSAMKSTNKSLKDQQEKLANDVINLYKEMYQKQKDIAVKAIDEEVKALEKAHREKIKMLDDEMKKYEEKVNAMTRSLDDQASEEDYNKQLNKLMRERDELQEKIDVKKLNNSREAQAELAELEKQLNEKREQIDEFQLNRSRDEQRKNLQRQLEDKRKSIDKEKEVADKAHDKDKERLDNLKKYTEKHYDELLNNEREFSRIREEIMNGNINRVMEQLNVFSSFIIKNSEVIGNSVSNNMLDKIQTISNSLQTTTLNLNKEFLNIVDNLDNTLIKKLDEIISKFKEIGNLSFDSRIDGGNRSPSSNLNYYTPTSNNEKSIIDNMKRNSVDWHNNYSNRYLLEQENQKLGKQIGATYNASTGTWYKDGLPLFHSNDTASTMFSPENNNLNNILGNGRSLNSTQLGGLVVSDNPLGNLIERIKGNIRNFDLGKLIPPAMNAKSITEQRPILINIEKVTGDQKGGEDVARTAIHILQSKGVF